MADPDWCQGNYMAQKKRPRRGLTVARMEAHITYLSEPALHRKFGRRLQERDQISYGFDADVEDSKPKSIRSANRTQILVSAPCL